MGKSWTKTCLNIDLRVYEVILDYIKVLQVKMQRTYKLQVSKVKIRLVQSIRLDQSDVADQQKSTNVKSL